MAYSPEEKKEWMQAIHKAISDCEKRKVFDTSLANNMKLSVNEARGFPKFAEQVWSYVASITH